MPARNTQNSISKTLTLQKNIKHMKGEKLFPAKIQNKHGPTAD